MTPTKGRARGVGLATGVLAVAGCSFGVSGWPVAAASGQVPGVTATSRHAAFSLQRCGTTVLRIWNDFLAGGAAWRRDLVLPGSPLDPAGGAPQPLGAGRVAVGAQGLARCEMETTSFVARELVLIARLGGPNGLAALRKKWEASTPEQRKRFEELLLDGGTSSSGLKVSSARVVSRSKDAATVRVVTTAASSSPLHGSTTDTVVVSRIGGRWFSSFLTSVNFSVSS